MNFELLQQYYSARAPEYDSVYKKPERQQDLREIEGWLPSTLQGRSVLEIACGTGYWTEYLARTARKIVAVDASEQVLDIAKSRVASPTVTFVQGDAYNPSKVSSAFDASFAGFWFSHVPYGRVQEFLLELHRVLAPGSRVVFLDNRFVDGSSTPVAEEDAEGNTYQVRKLQDGSAHRVLKNFPSEQKLRHAVAGLCSKVKYHEWQYFWALEYVSNAP